MPDNTVTLVGNITRDPELRFTPVGPGRRHLRPRRQPPLAEPPDQRVGGADLLLRRQVLGADGRERQRVAVPRAHGSSSPAASSSARGRPSTARSARRSRSSPTRSAPSLRWATAEVTKNERRDGGAPAAVAAAAVAAPSAERALRLGVGTTTTRSPSDGQGAKVRGKNKDNARRARRRSASSPRSGSSTSTTRT